jgi:hypothetical protein
MFINGDTLILVTYIAIRFISVEPFSDPMLFNFAKGFYLQQAHMSNSSAK